MSKTKSKGDIGEAKVIADLMSKGYKVLLPFGEDWRFDIVVYDNGRFLRVQSKYSSRDIDGVIHVRCSSSNNWSVRSYTEVEIDFLAIYHEPTNACYYIPAKLLGDNGRMMINLRLTPTKNKQSKGILWAKDFLNFK